MPAAVSDPGARAADLEKPAQGAVLQSAAGAALHRRGDEGAREAGGTDHGGFGHARRAGLALLPGGLQVLLLGLQVQLCLPLQGGVPGAA